jgi:hypothetical protein
LWVVQFFFLSVGKTKKQFFLNFVLATQHFSKNIDLFEKKGKKKKLFFFLGTPNLQPITFQKEFDFLKKKRREKFFFFF